MTRLHRILLFPEAGEGTGSPSATPTATPTPTPSPGDPAEGFRKLVEKHQNDTAQVALKLYEENHDYRQKLREARARVPAEGSLVLNPDEAKALSAYRALGSPEELTALKTEHGQYATERQAAAREKLHGQAAEAHGYKASVLSRLIDQDRLDVEVKDDKDKAGKPIKVAHVKDGDRTVTLPDYARAHWPDFLDALPKAPPEKPIGTPRIGGNLPDPPPGAEQTRRSFVR